MNILNKEETINIVKKAQADMELTIESSNTIKDKFVESMKSIKNQQIESIQNIA